MKKISAGILAYTKVLNEYQFLIVKPGGPYHIGPCFGQWGIPKGLVEQHEDLFVTAKREFEEETNCKLPINAKFIDLGYTIHKSGKKVYCWGINQLFDTSNMSCNLFELDNPPGWFPEVDEYGYFNVDEVRKRIIPEQFIFIERVLSHE